MLKVKQIQNLLQLNPNNTAEAAQMEKWEHIKAQDAERRAIARQQQMEGQEDEDGMDQAEHPEEIDWRGCYLPETL